MTYGPWVVWYVEPFCFEDISQSNSSNKIFQLATNEPLFPLTTFGLTREEIDKAYETLISQILGPSGQSGQDFARYLANRLPNDFGAENTQSLASFLLLMLQINPKRRLPTKDLLYAPFVSGISHS